MSPKLFPDSIQNSAYDIDYEEMFSRGIRGLIFDIDNTLVPHGAPPDDKAAELFSRLHGNGYKTFILSNNKEPRVRSFAEGVCSEYIYKAGKPSASGYLEAMNRMGTDCSNTVSVGDQIFTDVWGAGNAGIKSILVHRIDSHEEIQIHLKRIPEHIVLLFYRIWRRNGNKG